MSSILEHMCADVLQQTATQIKFPSTGMDTIPYWNLLPPKKPIKEVLTSVFTKVLEKGWVDSRSIHIFDTLLHMGGVYWFCNNLVKVRGEGGRWPCIPALCLGGEGRTGGLACAPSAQECWLCLGWLL